MIDLTSILEMWQKDCVIDNTKLDNTSRDTPKLHAKYLQVLAEAKLMKKRAEFSQKKLLKDKWLYYENKMTKEEIDERGWPYDPFEGLDIRTKHQRDYYYEADEDIQKSEEKIVYYRTVIETLEEIVGSLKWRHTHISNIIKWKQFEAGD